MFQTLTTDNSSTKVDLHSFATLPNKKAGFPFTIHLLRMSWLRGKKASVTNLKAEEANITRSTTPTPGNPDGKEEKRTFRSGLLTIRVMWAEGVSMPAGVAIPPAVQSALSSQQAKVAASISPSSVNQQRLANKSRGNRCALLICFHDTLHRFNLSIFFQ